MMKFTPVSHGKHNNLWALCKIKKFITFKVVCMLETGEAHIATCTTAMPYAIPYFDKQILHDELKNVIEMQDFVLMTPISDIFIKRGVQEQRDYLEPLYK